MRIFILIYIIFIVVTVSILGFRGELTEKEPFEVFSDMDRQAKYKPQAENAFYSNKQNDRLPPNYTVPRGNALNRDQVFDFNYKGRSKDEILLLSGKNEFDEFSDEFPFLVDYDLMQIGEESYSICCITCHGSAGDGNGVTKPYGGSCQLLS